MTKVSINFKCAIFENVTIRSSYREHIAANDLALHITSLSMEKLYHSFLFSREYSRVDSYLYPIFLAIREWVFFYLLKGLVCLHNSSLIIISRLREYCTFIILADLRHLLSYLMVLSEIAWDISMKTCRDHLEDT
jgi:hypothetical protein